MLKKLIFVFIILFSITFDKINLYGASKFIPGIDGLPLMDGLLLVPNSHVVFETLDGRIFEITAVGTNSPKDISLFYSATLRQLGWIENSKNEFWRDDDLLRIKVSTDKAGEFIVRFSIAPRPK